MQAERCRLCAAEEHCMQMCRGVVVWTQSRQSAASMQGRFSCEHRELSAGPSSVRCRA